MEELIRATVHDALHVITGIIVLSPLFIWAAWSDARRKRQR